jgi:hypothetical protein
MEPEEEEKLAKKDAEIKDLKDEVDAMRLELKDFVLLKEKHEKNADSLSVLYEKGIIDENGNIIE